MEIFNNNDFGTICDTHWTLREANVTCKSLGFPGAIAAIGGAYFGPGTGNVWMDNVFCTGNELFLQSCSFTGFGGVNCPHTRDAGVVCAGMGDWYLFYTCQVYVHMHVRYLIVYLCM